MDLGKDVWVYRRIQNWNAGGASVQEGGGGGWEALIFGFVGMRACARGAQMPNKPYSLNVRSNSNYMWFGCDLSVTGAFDACSRQPSPALHSCRPPCSLQASI